MPKKMMTVRGPKRRAEDSDNASSGEEDALATMGKLGSATKSSTHLSKRPRSMFSRVQHRDSNLDSDSDSENWAADVAKHVKPANPAIDYDPCPILSPRDSFGIISTANFDPPSGWDIWEPVNMVPELDGVSLFVDSGEINDCTKEELVKWLRSLNKISGPPGKLVRPLLLGNRTTLTSVTSLRSGQLKPHCVQLNEGFLKRYMESERQAYDEKMK